LFYGVRRIDHPRLKIPHPHWEERCSVRWPLSRLRKPLPGRLGEVGKRWRGRYGKGGSSECPDRLRRRGGSP
jgi:7,8-dihydro-6-hydroxymethylpterin-pyrophosphokinase